MMNHDFYHEMIRKYVVVFGTLFNEIYITRETNTGTELESFKVPLSYGPREKFLARVEQDPALDRGYSVLLPRIAFEIKNISYDGSRKLASSQKYIARNATEDGKSYYRSVFSPVPYNIDFELNVMVKYVEDGTRIIEQILPYFTPDWTMRAHLLDEMPDYFIDLPIVLTSVQQTDNYDQDFKTRRTVIWTLGFTLKGQFFGPIDKAKVIKVAKANFIMDWKTKHHDATVTVQPGLTANGEPTTLLANSVPVLNIEEWDNYGYIVTIEEPGT